MNENRDVSSVQAIMSSSIAERLHAKHVLPRRDPLAGFTLIELMVSVGVLVLIVFFTSQVFKATGTVTMLGHKQMDADAQGRQLLDRMAVDFAQMIKRSDVTYYWKGQAGGGQTGNDQMAFYSAVPGYYSTDTSTTQSPISLVGYRINTQNEAQRLGKGLLWNGVSLTEAPLLFWQAIAAPTDTDYTTSGEKIGPQVFRFEYSYLSTNGTLSGNPPSMASMAAIIVDIAVIDPNSKVLLTDAQLTALAGTLIDYGASAVAGCPVPNWQAPGELRRQWQCVLDSTTGLPQAAVSGIRLYERCFYLSPPTP